MTDLSKFGRVQWTPHRLALPKRYRQYMWDAPELTSLKRSVQRRLPQPARSRARACPGETPPDV
jgi:hypothetical protein